MYTEVWLSGESSRIVWSSCGLKLASPAVENSADIQVQKWNCYDAWDSTFW